MRKLPNFYIYIYIKYKALYIKYKVKMWGSYEVKFINGFVSIRYACGGWIDANKKKIDKDTLWYSVNHSELTEKIDNRLKCEFTLHSILLSLSLHICHNISLSLLIHENGISLSIRIYENIISLSLQICETIISLSLQIWETIISLSLQICETIISLSLQINEKYFQALTQS